MNKSDSTPKHGLRFNTPDDLLVFLAGKRNSEFSFRAVPISGEPETFHYQDDMVVRQPDGKTFIELDDFICYVFQCDAEGYARTEHVDVVMIDRV